LLARRRELLEGYQRGLAELDVCVLEHYTDKSSSSGHLCMVRLNGMSQTFRNLFIERMAEQQVSCNVHYKPLPLLTAYRELGFVCADYPNASAHYLNEVTLPLHTKLTDKDLEYVIESFKTAYQECVAARV
jgi:dTDP-4-amino-4,6-dideoxygalactose transaminase